MNLTRLTAMVMPITAILSGCATAPESLPPLTMVSHVDLNRFMGDWFVIASIPTFLEKGAHNAKDTYSLCEDGTIATTFTYNADSSTGPVKHYQSTGYILDPSTNAVWGQQYVWPVKADYRISYLSDDYSQTVITRSKRDYVWIMARSPKLSEADLSRLIAFVGTQGYDTTKLQRVPQD